MESEFDRIVRTRRSIRRFKPDMPSLEMVDAVVKAGLLAPTGRKMQSTIIVRIDEPGLKAEITAVNAKIMGKPPSPDRGDDPFYAAPDIVVVLADGDTPNWLQDGSLVMGNLMLAAYAVGAGSCWIRTCRKTNDSAFHLDSALLWALQATEREDYLFASP